jgi:hypothetical protein
VIERAGYRTEVKLGAGGTCPGCGRRLPIVLAGGQSATSLPH